MAVLAWLADGEAHKGSGNKADQPLFSRLWGSGFIPTQHQGVRFRGGGDPVLYLSNPPGVSQGNRRQMLDAVDELNRMAADEFGDPEINTRIAKLDDGKHVFYRDIGDKFLETDGTLSKEIMPDYLHLSAKGYTIWTEAIRRDVEKLLK